MTIETKVRFTDKGEAARFLAAIHSRCYELPRPMADALRTEFPYESYRDVSLTVIAAAAIATIQDKLPTTEQEVATERWAWQLQDPAIGPSLWWDYRDAHGVLTQRAKSGSRGCRLQQVLVQAGDLVSRLGAPDERVA